MAIYRNIQMSFWTDTKVADDFTPEDKYFYLYLFTNPHTNLAGCYEISIRQMSNETGYSKDTIERLIDRFRSVHNVIEYESTTKELLLINWHKYNWTKSRDFRKALEKEINSVKNPEFKGFLRGLYDDVDTVLRPSIDGVGTTVTDTDNNISPNKDKYIDIINKNITEHNYSIYISNILTEWFLYKKEKGQSYKPIGITKLLNKVDKMLFEYTEEDLGKVIEVCMERNYQGIIWDLLEKRDNKTTGSAYMDAIKNRVSQVDDWV